MQGIIQQCKTNEKVPGKVSAQVALEGTMALGSLGLKLEGLTLISAIRLLKIGFGYNSKGHSNKILLIALTIVYKSK